MSNFNLRDQIPARWVDHRQTRKKMGLKGTVYAPSNILGKSGVIKMCCEWLGVAESDLWVIGSNATYLHPLTNHLYRWGCKIKSEGVLVGQAQSDGRLRKVLERWIESHPNSGFAFKDEDEDPVFEVKAEIVEDPQPDPVVEAEVEDLQSEQDPQPIPGIQLKRQDYQRSDGYVNATKLCQSGGKDWSDYTDTKRAKNYLAALSSTTGIPVVGKGSSLIESNPNAPVGERHVWVHPRVATHLAQWISVEYEVQVNAWLVELHNTGKVELEDEGSLGDDIAEFDMMIKILQKQKQQALELKRQEMINQQTQQHLQRVELKIDEVQATQRKSAEELSTLPVEQLNIEDQRYWTSLIHTRVNDWCAVTGIPHPQAWGRFKTRAQTHLRINHTTRKNQGYKGTFLDLIRDMGLAQRAYAVACEVFPSEECKRV